MIEDLKNKIKLQRSIHSYFEQRKKFISRIIISISIIIPAFLTFLAFSDIEFLKNYFPHLSSNTLILLFGCFSFILFLLSIFTEIFKLTDVHKEHRSSIEQYSILLRNIKLFEKENRKHDETEVAIMEFNKNYLQIAGSSVSFTDSEFLRGEQYALRKEIIRQGIHEKPFLPLRQIVKESKKKK